MCSGDDCGGGEEDGIEMMVGEEWIRLKGISLPW